MARFIQVVLVVALLVLAVPVAVSQTNTEETPEMVVTISTEFRSQFIAKPGACPHCAPVWQNDANFVLKNGWSFDQWISLDGKSDGGKEHDSTVCYQHGRVTACANYINFASFGQLDGDLVQPYVVLQLGTLKHGTDTVSFHLEGDYLATFHRRDAGALAIAGATHTRTMWRGRLVFTQNMDLLGDTGVFDHRPAELAIYTAGLSFPVGHFTVQPLGFKGSVNLHGAPERNHSAFICGISRTFNIRRK